jgi:1A family penicillin-binding protein
MEKAKKYIGKSIKYLKKCFKYIKRRIKKASFKKWLFIFVGVGVILVGILMVWISLLKLPDFESFTQRKLQSSTKIYDRTGEILLYDIHQDIKRTVIPYEDMSIKIKNATVAIEDSTFYEHNGIRIPSIIRATIVAKITGKRVSGGSTITQQLIKNTLLTSRRTLTRKVKEWILAIKLEKVLSKEEILELYLNEAPYGGNIYGIAEASRAFFGKEPSEVTLAEAAYLAAIPNGPTYYSPYRKNKDKLDARKNLVLSRMLNLKFITEEEHKEAVAENVVFLPEQPLHIAAPHFVFFIKDYLETKYGVEAIEAGGLKVITTLDYELQKKAEEIALKNAKENEKNWNGKNAAVVVIDPKTGQLLSMVGSRDYFDKTIEGNFNVTTAQRQPGSSFKPIVYAQAFKEGYTQNTTLFDVRTEFNSSCDPLGKPLPGSRNATCYNPDNYDDAFRGPMTLKEGLAQSINVIAVKLLYLVGVNDSLKMAHDLGISSLNDPTRYGLSLVIGGGETSLLDMTSAYSVFANGGVRHPYTGVLSVENAGGEILEKYENTEYQVLDPNIPKILADILTDNNARTPTFGANSALVVPGREVAVKTGTTNNNKDAWTIGYTPSVTVGVWVGNNDNVPMKKGGAALAGPIWNGVISEALKKLPVETFEEPDPIDPSLPAILRGYWQGGETFSTDSATGAPASEFTPTEMRKEQSITNVHTILYWIDKNNPLAERPSNPSSDPQYTNWEYGVQRWWSENMHKYKIITSGSAPAGYNTTNTNTSKPIFEILGLVNSVYKKNQTINISINQKTLNTIKKIDVYVNNTYLTSLKSYPYKVLFTPNDISSISTVNTVRAIGYDSLGNTGETTATFQVEE